MNAISQLSQLFHEHPKLRNSVLTTVNYVTSQWFFIALGCLVAIAHSFPNFARHGGQIRAEYTIGFGSVAVIFFLSGITTKTQDLIKNLGNWRAHFTVMLSSFLITSSITFGILTGILASNNPKIDDWMLVGLVITACCPTTIASNVIMTRNAHGNELLSLCEAFIGNLCGTFITPLLVQMYFKKGTRWEFANPTNDGHDTLSHIFLVVIKQIGLSVFMPLVVGQVVRSRCPEWLDQINKKYSINRFGSVMLLTTMFMSFSTAFYQKSFLSVQYESIVFICFFNLGIYLLFTCICFLFARPPLNIVVTELDKDTLKKKNRIYQIGYEFFQPFYYSKQDAVAIMYCAPTKTAALGVSLVTIQYGEHNPNLGKLIIPLVMYQAEQVLCGGLLVSVLRRWVEYPIRGTSTVQAESTVQDSSVMTDSDTLELATISR